MRIKFEGKIVAKTPIFHGGDEKTGSTPILRTITIYDSKENRNYILPYISGNSIRGKLRRLIMHDFFTRLEYEPDLKLHHIFYSGGVLETTEKMYGNVDLELRKNIRDFIIPLSLFGASVGNQVLTGKLQVGHIFPVCKEYAGFLPEEFRKLEASKKSVRLFTDDSFITRRDDMNVERDVDEQAVQMKVDYECFIPGTIFYHWFALDYPTELEMSCFGHMISLFRETPFLGGRSSQGDGEVEFEYTPEIPDENKYLEFLKENKEDIKKVLDDIKLRFTSMKVPKND